jgi:hypothetical protein
MSAKYPMRIRVASVGVVIGICGMACSSIGRLGSGDVVTASVTPSKGNTATPSLEPTDIEITETRTPSPVPPTATRSRTKPAPEIQFKEIDNPGFSFDQMTDLSDWKPGRYFSFLGNNMDISETDDTLSVFYVSSDLKNSGQLFRMAQWNNFSQEGYFAYGGSNLLFLNEGSYTNPNSIVLSFHSSSLRAYSFFAGSRRLKCGHPSQDQNQTEIIRLVCSSDTDVLVKFSMQEFRVISLQYLPDRYDSYRWIDNDTLLATPYDREKSTMEYYCLFDASLKKEECHHIGVHVEFISGDMQWAVISYPEDSAPPDVASLSSKRIKNADVAYVVPLACIQMDSPNLNGECAPVRIIAPENIIAPVGNTPSYSNGYIHNAKLIIGDESDHGGLVLWSFDIQTRKTETVYSSDEYYSCDQWNEDRKGFFCSRFIGNASGHPIFVSLEGDAYNLAIKGISLSEFFLLQ